MTPDRVEQIKDNATKIWREWERLDGEANSKFVYLFMERAATDPLAWDRAAGEVEQLLREGEPSQAVMDWAADQISKARKRKSIPPADNRGADKTAAVKFTQYLRLAALTAYLHDEFDLSAVADAWTVVADATGVDARTVQRAWSEFKSEGKARVEAVRADAARLSAAN